MDPMIKNSFFTILIYWNDNRIHLGLTKKLIFFILFPPLFQMSLKTIVVFNIEWCKNCLDNEFKSWSFTQNVQFVWSLVFFVCSTIFKTKGGSSNLRSATSVPVYYMWKVSLFFPHCARIELYIIQHHYCHHHRENGAPPPRWLFG